MFLEHVAAVDQGTSSTRVVVFDRSLRPVRTAVRKVAVHAPAPGWLQVKEKTKRRERKKERKKRRRREKQKKRTDTKTVFACKDGGWRCGAECARVSGRGVCGAARVSGGLGQPERNGSGPRQCLRRAAGPCSALERRPHRRNCPNMAPTRRARKVQLRFVDSNDARNYRPALFSVLFCRQAGLAAAPRAARRSRCCRE